MVLDEEHKEKIINIYLEQAKKQINTMLGTIEVIGKSFPNLSDEDQLKIVYNLIGSIAKEQTECFKAFKEATEQKLNDEDFVNNIKKQFTQEESNE